MRFRYDFENGKHLVKTRDDAGEWLESRSYPTEEEAKAVVAKGESMESGTTIAEVEKAMTGPKGTAHHGVAPKAKAEPELPVKTEGATKNVPDLKPKAEPAKAPAKKPAAKASSKATRGSKPRK